MIQRESVLVAKEITPGLNVVLTTILTVVDYIKTRSLKFKLFLHFLHRHLVLLFYCEARWNHVENL